MTITIRRASLKDAAGYARLMGDPAVYPGLMQMPYASEERWTKLLGEMNELGKPDLNLIAERDGEVVGSAGLHAAGMSPRRRHVMSLGLAVARDAQRQGVGSALMTALCEYADRWLGTLRIELSVYSDNEHAVALYRKFGFEIEGRMRGYAMRDGVYVDAYAMARLHPAPPGIAPAPAG